MKRQVSFFVFAIFALINPHQEKYLFDYVYNRNLKVLKLSLSQDIYGWLLSCNLVPLCFPVESAYGFYTFGDCQEATIFMDFASIGVN